MLWNMLWPAKTCYGYAMHYAMTILRVRYGVCDDRRQSAMNMESTMHMLQYTMSTLWNMLLPALICYEYTMEYAMTML